jgi:phenol hydroxylase P2 protein
MIDAVRPVSKVSITFANNDDSRAIIDAIVADNPGVEIVTMPAVVKIDHTGSLAINRASVEERLGRSWDIQELHLSLVTLAGNVDEDDDRFVLAWRS